MDDALFGDVFAPVEAEAPPIGLFGADPIKRSMGDNLRGVGALFSDIGGGINGRGPVNSEAFRGEMDKRQGEADWSLQLDGMADLTPEMRTFAQANPDAFKEMKFAESQTKQKNDELMKQLAGLDLPPEVLARAQMNPAGFMEEMGKGAGKTQTETHQDPVTGEWNIRPQIGLLDDFAFVNNGEDPVQWTERPQSQEDIETARAAKAEEELEKRRLGISERNARTAELNAGRTPGKPGRPPRAIIDDEPPFPGEEPIDYRGQGEGFIEGMNGGRLIRVGVGADGRYAPTDGDPEIPQGKKFPPPAFNLIEGLGDKAGPTINLEEKKMNAIDATRDSAVLLKSLNDKYITQSEGYPFGAMPWDGARQWADPRTKGLEGLNAQMALEIGKMAKGAMSDADRDWFVKAAPNAAGKPESNATFAMRANAIANNANQYSAFMKAYRAEYGVGSLSEAQRYWDMYSLANPIFDDNGDAADNRMTFNEFFTGSRAKRDDIFERDYPGVRGDSGGGKLSKAEQDELDQLRRELGQQ